MAKTKFNINKLIKTVTPNGYYTKYETSDGRKYIIRESNKKLTVSMYKNSEQEEYDNEIYSLLEAMLMVRTCCVEKLVERNKKQEN